jgi:hypothetical protein
MTARTALIRALRTEADHAYDQADHARYEAVSA